MIRFIQDLTRRVTATAATAPVADDPAIDIWVYAEPANEESDPLKRNVLQWRRLISSVREPLLEFPGQPVNVIGFVHRTSTDGPEQFTIARRVIRCCLADTVPLGLTVYTPKAEQLNTDSWLHIRGTFAVRSIRNRSTLVIIPDTMKAIAEPKKLYINGVF